jgi:hypothetical protein
MVRFVEQGEREKYLVIFVKWVIGPFNVPSLSFST